MAAFAPLGVQKPGMVRVGAPELQCLQVVPEKVCAWPSEAYCGDDNKHNLNQIENVEGAFQVLVDAL